MRLSKSPSDKLNDTLLLIGTLAVGLDFLPLLIGDAYFFGKTPAWFVFPILLPISVLYKKEEYLSCRLHKMLFIFIFCLLVYSLNAGYEISASSDWGVFTNIKMGANSLIIFSFFFIHCKTLESRMVFIQCLIIASIIAIILNFMGILGFIQGASDQVHLGYSRYIKRVSTLGDANISTIYLIAGVASLPLMMFKFSRNKSVILWLFVMSACFWITFMAATRGGFIALVATLIVLLLNGNIGQKRNQKIYIFVSLIICISIIYFWPYVLKISGTLLTRSAQLFSGNLDSSTKTRLMSLKWLIQEIFLSPNFFGIGYRKFCAETSNMIGNICPHQTFVDFYIIGGIPMLLGWLYIWKHAISSTWHCSKDRDWAFSAQCQFFFPWLCGVCVLLMSLSIPWTKLIWATLGVCFRLSFEKRKKKIFSNRSG